MFIKNRTKQISYDFLHSLDATQNIEYVQGGACDDTAHIQYFVSVIPKERMEKIKNTIKKTRNKTPCFMF